MPLHRKLPKLDLNITNRCNFRCVHCAFDSGIEHMSELSVKEIKKILTDTKELGGERIDLTGGEPTVREDLADIIKVGKSLGYKIELVTNGSIITEEKLAYFRSLGLDAIAISLDGSTYDIYSRIRKVNEKTFKHVLKMIEKSVELGFYTKVNTTVFTSNLHDLPAITQWCIEKGVQENGIYYFTPVGRGNRADELSVEPIRWLKFIKENLLKYDSKIKLSLEFPLIEKDFPKKGLGCILKEDPYHLQILPDGNVYPCAILASYHKPIANLHEVSIKDIWNNKKLWKDYHQKISSEVFKKYNGFCTDFCAFNMKEYTSGKYKFVCPLRKFIAGELK